MISVSVIIPVYQSCTTIAETIESVLAQTHPVSEIIVVDDGSTDELDAVLKPYLNRIQLIRQKNAGAAAARNNGIRHATGEIIAFLDADDVWLPKKIELQLPLFDDPNTALVFGNVYFFQNREVQNLTYFDLFEPRNGLVFSALFAQNFVPILSVLLRAEILKHTGMFDESIRYVEDYDLWLRIAKEHRFDFISTPVAAYRISSTQISKNFTRAAEALLQLKERFFLSAKDALENCPREVLNRGLFMKYLKLALCYLRDGNKSQARRVIERYRELNIANTDYLLFRVLVWLPIPISQFLVRLWDKFHQKPELGYY